MTRIDDLLRDARARIDLEDASALLAEAAGRSRTWLYTHGDAECPPSAEARFDALVARRLGGEPVAYLLGRRGFWRFDLQVSPATLIPRPETELLVEHALRRLPDGRPARVADLGTGSGAVALAIAHECPATRIVATDTSPAALAVARANAHALGLGRVEFRLGHWCRPLGDDRFDLIASNPPYIAEDDVHLSQGDLRYEPPGALASGTDGLDAIREIVRDAPTHLVPGGWLLLEHGWQQGAAVRALLSAAGFVDVATEKDLEARDRVTLGRQP